MTTAALEVIHAPHQASALLDPTRRQLLARLGEPDSAAGLSRKLGLPRQRINYHLRALEKEGLVELVEERRRGNCTERVVRATARSFVISPEALGVLGATPEAARDRFSAAYLMSVAAGVLRDVGTLEARARRENKRLATLTLDAEVRFATAAARSAFADELAAAVASLVARYHDDDAADGRSFRLVVGVHPAAAAKAAGEEGGRG